ncbi:MAG: DNA-binding protein [Elusimicrobia bacterium]|nr:DNA-binding protein [Elusimicrobiota bacterium]
MKQIKIRVKEGEKLIRTLEKELKKRGITSATIVSCVGALREFEIITIYQKSKKIPPDHFAKKFKKKVELLANGIVEKGRVHLHASLGAEGGKAFVGHLVEGVVTYFADTVFLVG